MISCSFNDAGCLLEFGRWTGLGKRGGWAGVGVGWCRGGADNLFLVRQQKAPRVERWETA